MSLLLNAPIVVNASREACCADCGCEGPATLIHGVTDDALALRIGGLLEVDADEPRCGPCRDALEKEAKWTICRHCGRPECPGPVHWTDADKRECPRWI